MNRKEQSEQVYEKLFGILDTSKEQDPEFMEILRKFIFGDVFHIGNLEMKTRELISVVILTTLQTLPQLKAHIHGALHIGNTPEEIREAIYQCAPFIGFPKTLNAIQMMNDVFFEKGIVLPLAKQGQVNDDNRYVRGSAIQYPLYGDEIKDKMKVLPEPFSEAIPDFLTTFCFGDFYTRGILDVKTRELLILCGLTALRANEQIKAHIQGCLRAGNDVETMLSALLQCLPYIGFPATFASINLVKEIL